MADDSWDIDSIMEFHPCNRPHGMKDYVLSDLTAEQQMKLNVRKREQIRTDQKYLAAHPEVCNMLLLSLCSYYTNPLTDQRFNCNDFTNSVEIEA
jgi:hypothetical protein